MKLLFVIKAMGLSGGGAERVLANVAGALVLRGHEVTLLTFDRVTDKDFYPLDSRIKRVKLEIGNAAGRSTLFETIRRIVALRRVAKCIQPEAAIGFMHSAFVPLGLALVHTGIPVLASEHIVFGHYRTRRFQGLLLGLGALLADRMTVISENIRSTFPAFVARRMVVVTNPVYPTRGQADPVGGADKILLSVGRLEAQKDQRTLVAAFSQLRADFPEWRLRIVGEGELRPQLERQIAALGIGGRVDLPGSTDLIEEEYVRAQLFVIPSTYESFGLVTAEALAQGLPAVGFADCPGTNELIQPGVNGVLAQGADRVAALAASLRTMMSSPDLRLRYGKTAPATVVRFSIDSVTDRWERVLRSLGSDA